MPCSRATAAIFAAGPTRIGSMMPASAASTAPRSEVSSQGCTTMVAAGGTSLARAISRSYFACGGCGSADRSRTSPISSSAMSLARSSRRCSASLRRPSPQLDGCDAMASDAGFASTSNSSATRCSRSAASPTSSPRALSTCRIEVERLAARPRRRPAAARESPRARPPGRSAA